MIDLNKTNKKGITNLELMKAGKAPIGPDGKRINLHHTIQTQEGALAEVTETFHIEHSKTIHINPPATPSGINRPLFDVWREDYWKARVQDLQKQ